MKKLALVMLAFTLVLGACSKEKKVNKNLDGSWELSMVNDAAPNRTAVITFNVDKKEGTYSIDGTDQFGNELTEEGSYTLDGNVLSTESQSYTITKYEDTELELLSTDGTTETKESYTKK